MSGGSAESTSAPRDVLRGLADAYQLDLIYAFGSRGKSLLEWSARDDPQVLGGTADADIGVKPREPLSVADKVAIAQRLEDALGVPRVDLLSLDDADPFVAANVIRGELLFAHDRHFAAEYELYVLRRAGDLAPYERERLDRILGR